MSIFKKKNCFRSILVMPDLHVPYQHKDAFAFLCAVKKKYKPDLIVNIGDEIDNHAISFHDKDPDLPSPGDELKLAIKHMKPFYKEFPNVKVLESNHGSLVFRKALHVGLPRAVFKTYNQIIEAPPGWTWHIDLKVDTPNGLVYFHHGKTCAIEKLSKSMACNSVQGHFHNKFYISYWASPRGLFWDVNCGCLADWHALALAYAKSNVQKPVLGCVVILDGRPKLIPMKLKGNGRWDGKVRG